MKVVALVSGGKDSCYNMMLCQHYGHEVVALGNLLPVAPETDDLDSYMYQTVGHQVIAAYARCMALPLYRRRILGASADQRLVYEDTEGDEVEDLAALLAYVRERHPDVVGVASGAIASDYQRTRVERVCARLGLVSLAYLWHQPQAALLRRMVDGGIDAILVKIAAAGLTPGKHLGARLAALPAQLHALRRLYGSNVCGEGGEYESLTLDCPLFSHGRIVLDSWQAVAVSEDSLAPIALLHPTAFHIQPKGAAAEAAAGADSEAAAAAAAAGEAEEAEDAAAAVIEVPDSYAAPAPAPPAAPDAAQAALQAALQVHLACVDGGQYCSLTASVPHPGPGGPDLCSAAGTAAALAAALGRLSAALPALGLDWRASLFVHLYVPSMAQFGAANAAYAAVLPAINPPSRATVQLGGGAGLALVVEVLFTRRALGERRVLHVQSVSEWAPSCIGPYSQATRHRGLALFAGQIALDPPTMELVSGGIDAQCVRCLVSCQRVAVAVRTDLPQALLWCTLYCSDAAGAAGRVAAAAHLSAFLAGQLDESLLQGAAEQRRQRRRPGSCGCEAEDNVGGGGSTASSSSDDGGNEADEDDLAVDEYLQPPAMRRHWQPLLAFVTVPELPRGVLVEVQPAACLADESLQEDSSSSSDSEDDEAVAAQRSRRRAEAAAARPPGSGMPGWIGRLQAASSSGGGGRLWSPGRLCKVLACVGQPAAAHDWQAAVQAAAQELAAGVAAAGLSAADVAACKVYCLAGLLGSPQGPTAEALQAAVAAALPGARPAVVPVTAVGTSAAASSALLLETLAIRS